MLTAIKLKKWKGPVVSLIRKQVPFSADQHGKELLGSKLSTWVISLVSTEFYLLITGLILAL